MCWNLTLNVVIVVKPIDLETCNKYKHNWDYL